MSRLREGNEDRETEKERERERKREKERLNRDRTDRRVNKKLRRSFLNPAAMALISAQAADKGLMPQGLEDTKAGERGEGGRGKDGKRERGRERGKSVFQPSGRLKNKMVVGNSVIFMKNIFVGSF